MKTWTKWQASGQQSHIGGRNPRVFLLQTLTFDHRFWCELTPFHGANLYPVYQQRFCTGFVGKICAWIHNKYNGAQILHESHADFCMEYMRIADQNPCENPPCERGLRFFSNATNIHILLTKFHVWMIIAWERFYSTLRTRACLAELGVHVYGEASERALSRHLLMVYGHF